MKKKIRDLTEDDALEICGRHSCRECPLHLMLASCIQDLINHLDYLSDKVLDREVEL